MTQEGWVELPKMPHPLCPRRPDRVAQDGTPALLKEAHPFG